MSLAATGLETLSPTNDIERSVSERDPDQASPSNEPPANKVKTGTDRELTGAADPASPAEPVPNEDVSNEEVAGTDEPANRRARRAAAAQARKQRMREREDAQAVGLGAQEILDDAFVRSTDTAGKWVRKNSSIIQWLLVAGVASWAAWGVYDWRRAHVQAEASDALAQAAQAQFGKVGIDESADDEMADLDPTPSFVANDTAMFDLTFDVIDEVLLPADLEYRPDFAVIDVSFISLTTILEPLLRVLGEDGTALLMVKPQFEVGRARLGAGGIVRDAALHREAVANVVGAAEALGWQCDWQGQSRLPGGNGNVEFFVRLNR